MSTRGSQIYFIRKVFSHNHHQPKQNNNKNKEPIQPDNEQTPLTVKLPSGNVSLIHSFLHSTVLRSGFRGLGRRWAQMGLGGGTAAL